LFQNYDISGCHSKYSFFLHCGDDYRAEALRGHGGLDDVGVLLSFFCRRFTQINTDYFKKLKLKDYFLRLVCSENPASPH